MNKKVLITGMGVVTGWLDAESGEKFNAEIYIIEK